MAFERFPKTKMTFENILEYSRLIPAWFYTIFILFWREIDEHRWKSRKIGFQYKIPHFYPLWGAYSMRIEPARFRIDPELIFQLFCNSSQSLTCSNQLFGNPLFFQVQNWTPDVPGKVLKIVSFKLLTDPHFLTEIYRFCSWLPGRKNGQPRTSWSPGKNSSRTI